MSVAGIVSGGEDGEGAGEQCLPEENAGMRSRRGSQYNLRLRRKLLVIYVGG